VSINDYLKHNFKTVDKLETKKDTKIEISVNSIDIFGKTLFIDNEAISTQKDHFIYEEMLTHVSMCTHQNPKKVLILGNRAGGVAKEVLKYPDVEIDIIEESELLIEIADEYFDFISTKENKNITIINQNHLQFLKTANDDTYDVVLISDLQKDEDKYYHLNRILKADGLFASRASSLWSEPDRIKKALISAGDFFKICMPYRYESYVNSGSLSNMILCSKRYHPTADIILQRADFLPNLKYYNSDIQKASFVLPQYNIEALKGASKN
jgi:spermidine synthase